MIIEKFKNLTKNFIDHTIAYIHKYNCVKNGFFFKKKKMQNNLNCCHLDYGLKSLKIRVSDISGENELRNSQVVLEIDMRFYYLRIYLTNINILA